MKPGFRGETPLATARRATIQCSCPGGILDPEIASKGRAVPSGRFYARQVPRNGGRGVTDRPYPPLRPQHGPPAPASDDTVGPRHRHRAPRPPGDRSRRPVAHPTADEAPPRPPPRPTPSISASPAPSTASAAPQPERVSRGDARPDAPPRPSDPRHLGGDPRGRTVGAWRARVGCRAPGQPRARRAELRRRRPGCGRWLRLVPGLRARAAAEHGLLRAAGDRSVQLPDLVRLGRGRQRVGASPGWSRTRRLPGVPTHGR